jgi:hypothetical protein
MCDKSFAHRNNLAAHCRKIHLEEVKANAGN